MATYAEQIKTLKKKIANFDMTGGGKTSQKAKTLEQWKKELKRLQSLPETNKEQLSTLRDELKRLEEGGAYKPTRTANWMPGSGAHTNRVKTLKNTISDLGGDLEDKANPVVSIDDKEVEVSSDPKILSSSIRGKQKSNLSDQALSREEESGEVGENQNWVQTPSPTWGMNDTDRVNKANIQIAINAANQNKKVSEIGGKEYVTDYQTAVRNAGGPWGDVEQYYGEDVLDSAGNRVRKSNVFTLDEDGNPMGVKTRRQRLAEDLKRQEAQNKAKPNLVQTPSPTWTVDPNKKQQPESTQVNVQESSVPSGTSFKPVALSPEYADSIFFDPENFAK